MQFMQHSILSLVALAFILAPTAPADDVTQKSLPLSGETFLVKGKIAFVIPPAANPADIPIPWVWYAPTLPNLPGKAEKWMFDRFTQAGIAIAGVDVGESYGSPDGRALYSALYRELVGQRGFSPTPVMMGRSRGGLMTLAWAVDNADKVAGFAGVYPVCSITSYPGVKRATLRSCLKLCVGFGPGNSGVMSSGNGPSMRAPILGAAVDSLDVVLRLNHLSSRITHTDPLAEHGAAAVAIAAWGAARNGFTDHATYFQLLRERLTGEHAEQLLAAMDKVEASLATEESTQEFCCELCGPAGATGYTLHTVPVAIHAWLRCRGHLNVTLCNVILCGGDTDSTAAIAGGIAGCETEVTDELANSIMDWPCNPRWIIRLSKQLIRVTETGLPERPLQSSFPMQALRNSFFLVVVLLWGLRRLLPPW